MKFGKKCKMYGIIVEQHVLQGAIFFLTLHVGAYCLSKDGPNCQICKELVIINLIHNLFSNTINQLM